MKKRLFFAFGLCAVAAIVFWRTRPPYIEPPTQRPTEAELKQLFPADSRAVFENADRMTLYSIDHYPKPNQANTFHYYPIIGKTEIADVKTRRALVAHLYNGIAKSDGVSAACFNPRHAIRASKGGKTVDIVICFGCQNLQVHYQKSLSYAPITRAPQNFYNSVLQEAGVPLAKE